MTHPFLQHGLIVLVALTGWGPAATAQVAHSPGDPPKATPTPAPPTITKAAPDAPVPDLGTLPTEREQPKTVPGKISRKLKDAVPRCLDGMLHVCWAQPSAPEGTIAKTPEGAKYLKDIEVGDYYLQTRNYPGAALRYQHALTVRPNDPEATFKLALAQEKMGKSDDARCNYRAFLRLGPNEPFASQAQKALAKLKPAGTEGGCPDKKDQADKPLP